MRLGESVVIRSRLSRLDIFLENPLHRLPAYGLTIDSFIPTLEAGAEDEEKLKAAFQRTWAVDVLVDLLRLENKRDTVEQYLKACPVEALLCGQLRSELEDLNRVLHASDPAVAVATLKEIIHKFRTEASLMLHKRRPRFVVLPCFPCLSECLD